MSVYTNITESMLNEFLFRYDLGKLRKFKGIDGGTDNTNYFVSTDQHELVLTIFENLPADELPFFLSLGDHLHQQGCKVAQPFHDKSGDILEHIAGKPAVLFERLKGGHIPVPSQEQCFQIGKALGEIHNALDGFSGDRKHQLSLIQLKQNMPSYQKLLSNMQLDLLNQALDLLKAIPQDLPTGVIHADLFHDNALFDGDRLAGIIDWYFAGIDFYALDLAIIINDWCRHGLTFQQLKIDALIAGYEGRRKLLPSEFKALPLFQIQAAMRFWLTRTWVKDQLKDSDQEQVTIKAPEEMEQLLRSLIENYKD